MPKLPAVTPKQLISILKFNGFLLDHITGSHYFFYHPIKKLLTTIPFHNKDIPKGTLVAILKQTGISRDEL